MVRVGSLGAIRLEFVERIFIFAVAVMIGGGGSCAVGAHSVASHRVTRDRGYYSSHTGNQPLAR